MKSLKFNNTWDISLDDVDELQLISSNEVVIAIEYCGICGTDVGIASGDYPVAVPGTTLGHEATGIVLKIGKNVDNVQIGDRVVVNPTAYCGECRMCRSLRINHCYNKFGLEGGVSYDGAFSEQYITTSNCVHKLSDSTSLKDATLTEPLSCVLAGVKKIESMPTNVNSFVFGAGPMGLLYTWALTLKGYFPIVIEQSQERYDFAKNKLPEKVSIYLTLEEAISDRYSNIEKPLDIVVDTTPSILNNIIPALSCSSIYLSIGLKKNEILLNTMELADKSLSIVGSIDSLHGTFAEALNIIENNIIPVSTFISHIFELSDYNLAFTMLGCDLSSQKMSPVKSECGKILLKI